MVYRKKTICPYDCPQACGLEVETDGEKIFKVDGDSDHPIFRGLICSKMRGYHKSVHAEKRILTPQKRVGKKGEGKFEPVSWEEAVKDITGHWKEILSEHGPDAMLGLSSSGTQGRIQKFIVDAFFNKMGARRMIMTLCNGARNAAYESVTGGTGCLCGSELERCDYYLIWGCNLKGTRVHTLPVLEKARKNGKKVVIIDVCAVDDAQYADETILIRPGSDGALALAMMHVLAKEGLTADDMMKERTEGYEAFRATLDQYTPEWAAPITGIRAETIVRLALEYGACKAPAVIQGTGLSRRKSGGMNSRLILILSFITGTWGKGGGITGGDPRGGKCFHTDRIRRPDLRTRSGKTANINLLSEVLSETEEKEAVYGFYLSGGNIVNSVHNQKLTEQGLKREDLFTVVHEQVMTDTAKYADYILPAAYSVETTDCYTAATYATFGTAYQVLKPAGEAKSNWDTMRLFAEAMGYEEEIFRMTEEEMLAKILEEPGDALADLTEEEKEILKKGGTVMVKYSDHQTFATPSGKFRIIDETLEDAMPCYREDFRDPYPLNLVAIPGVHTLNTVFLSREDLVERCEPRAVLIHPAEAESRGICDGDEVLLKNDLAEVPFIARVTELVSKGCAAVQGVFGKEVTGQALQVNALHHSRLSDIGEGTTLNGNYVEIVKA